MLALCDDVHERNAGLPTVQEVPVSVIWLRHIPIPLIWVESDGTSLAVPIENEPVCKAVKIRIRVPKFAGAGTKNNDIVPKGQQAAQGTALGTN